ncbi:glycoside hydrolase family 37 protein [Coprinellus micaceus]|uniref:Trehalase n=1 Tax=Coprinellus micaceus TaxID=71717 RepID=A0A4Y7U2A1_COPMI|nr:glycoside hydrolase family 37 protein [Coprinellus micaceus]
MARSFWVAAGLWPLLLASSVCGQDSTATAPATTEVPAETIATAVPSATGALESLLPSQTALPPKQAWCPSEIFCVGELLQTVNVAHLYPDDKTFVDKPTSKSSREVLNDFRNISSGTTYGQIVSFLEQDFTGEGRELQPLTLPNFNAEPAFLRNVSDPLVKGFAQAVHGFWTQLIRGTNSSTFSLIPLNHTFVVPGGRFREQYYWDSFWIVEGLLESELYDIVNATLQNFMDELDTIGFIPNGGRIYYLNRSQPPLFIQVSATRFLKSRKNSHDIRCLSRYVAVSGDRSILTRALPLAEKELTWWSDNRSLSVRSPFTNQTHKVYHYSVNNSAPRPESYLTDYTTANDPNLPSLNDTQKAALYAELASGAESGWDYTVRWFNPGADHTTLRNLNVRNAIAVDLNSIIYGAHLALRDLYSSSQSSRRNAHTAAADALREAILDLNWDSNKLAFYDFNIGTNSRNELLTAAAFYPFWSGIIPDEVLKSKEAAFGAFSSVYLVMNRYNGTFPATFVDTHQQWDAPNAWPPHQYIILQALRHLPSNVTGGAFPSRPEGQSTFGLVPTGQLGVEEAGPDADVNLLNGTVINGGNATESEGWAEALERQLANRYYASTLCSWLSEAELNVTGSASSNGHMFEKFSNLDIDSAGRGGEYVVQAGFGWTNGVLLWVASRYGKVLAAPQCPNLLDEVIIGGDNSGATGDSGNAANSLRVPAVALSFILPALISFFTGLMPASEKQGTRVAHIGAAHLRAPIKEATVKVYTRRASTPPFKPINGDHRWPMG